MDFVGRWSLFWHSRFDSVQSIHIDPQMNEQWLMITVDTTIAPESNFGNVHRDRIYLVPRWVLIGEHIVDYRSATVLKTGKFSKVIFLVNYPQIVALDK